jgi:cysteine desulfurase
VVGVLDGGPIHLDYNSTTPVDPRVAEAAKPYLTAKFGNPSNVYAYAVPAREALDRARGQVAALIGARPTRWSSPPVAPRRTTSRSAARSLPRRRAGAHVVTRATEHPAVLETCAALRRLRGVDVTELRVDGTGRVDPDEPARAVKPETVLVSIMCDNDETGTVQPVAEPARIARERGALFHTDAAQAVGKAALGVDLLTVAGHKLYAPKASGRCTCAPACGSSRSARAGVRSPLRHRERRVRGRRRRRARAAARAARRAA